MPGLRLRVWTAEEFAASKAQWDALLARSDADPLFMSWDWQWHWWSWHERVLRASLKLGAIYTPEGRLVGLAPFYTRKATVRGFLASRRIELIGGAWRDRTGAFFSDYLDLIADRGCADGVLKSAASWLMETGEWQEMALSCAPRKGMATRLVGLLSENGIFVRAVDPSTGWRVKLPERFEAYVAGLTSDVRRKMFRHRAKVRDLRIQEVTADEVSEVVELLSKLVRARWGEDGAAALGGGFLREIGDCMARQGRLRMTRLLASTGLISVMMNIRAGDTLYYIQSGLDTQLADGFSPGYLHLGYAIEAACAEKLNMFDLLAGRGRHRDYKRDLGGEAAAVVTYHAVRGFMRRGLYGAYEWTQDLTRARRSPAIRC